MSNNISGDLARNCQVIMLLFLIIFWFGGAGRVLAQTQLGGDIDGKADDKYFGASVSLSTDGKRLAIGASGNDENGDNSGHVRVYELYKTPVRYGGLNIPRINAAMDKKAEGK